MHCQDALEVLLGVSGVHLNKKQKYIYLTIFNVFLYHFVSNNAQNMMLKMMIVKVMVIAKGKTITANVSVKMT